MSVSACGQWVGYYPTQFDSSVFFGYKINFDLIGTSACYAGWYGEVYDPTPTVWTNANMGSGQFASEGWARAAYIRQPNLLLTSGGFSWFSGTLVSGAGHDTDCYSVSDIFMNGGSGWDRWYFIGGPGGDNAGCN